MILFWEKKTFNKRLEISEIYCINIGRNTQMGGSGISWNFSIYKSRISWKIPAPPTSKKEGKKYWKIA
jgi:hypothetical protein